MRLRDLAHGGDRRTAALRQRFLATGRPAIADGLALFKAIGITLEVIPAADATIETRDAEMRGATDFCGSKRLCF